MPVGRLVGRFVGRLVGLFVGLGVGANVGASVGTLKRVTCWHWRRMSLYKEDGWLEGKSDGIAEGELS